MQSVSARQRASGPVHWTPHVHKACYQGIRKTCLLGHKKTVFNWGPKHKNKKIKKEDGRHLFFGGCCQGVLDAEDDVGAGAARGALLQEVAAL